MSLPPPRQRGKRIPDLPRGALLLAELVSKADLLELLWDSLMIPELGAEHALHQLVQRVQARRWSSRRTALSEAQIEKVFAANRKEGSQR